MKKDILRKAFVAGLSKVKSGKTKEQQLFKKAAAGETRQQKSDANIFKKAAEDKSIRRLLK